MDIFEKNKKWSVCANSVHLKTVFGNWKQCFLKMLFKNVQCTQEKQKFNHNELILCLVLEYLIIPFIVNL